MTAIVRLYRSDVLLADEPIDSANISDGINRSGTWAATIPANSLVAELIEEGDYVQIVYNGRLLMAGVTTVVERQFIGAKTIQVSGYNDLDELYQDADDKVWSNNEPVIFPISRILRDTEWRLTDISSMESPLDLVTLDVRNSDTRAVQMVELLKASRITNFRRGGDKKIEIGRFNRANGYLFTDPSPALRKPSSTTGIVTDFSVKEDNQDIIGAITPLGGEVSDSTAFRKKTNLSLRYAVDSNPALEYDDKFPIEQTSVKADYRVYNRALGAPGGKKTNEIYLIDGGNFSDSSRLVGDVDATVTIVNRNSGFLIRPLHGYLKNIRFFITLTSANTAIPITILARKIPSGNPLSFSGIDNIYANRATNPSVIFYQDFDSFAAVPKGVYEISFEDNEVLINPNDRVAIFFLIPTPAAVNNNYLNIAIHSSGGYYTSNTMDGYWQFNDTAGFTGAWTISNSVGLLFSTESYPTGEYRHVNTTWGNYRPNDDGVDATAAEKLAASLALYERAKAELADNALIKKTYDMRAIVDIDFPKIGEKVRVQVQSRTARKNRYTQKLTTVVRSIFEEFMVQAYDLRIDDNKLNVNFSIVEGDGITNVDRFLFTSVYDQTKEAKDKNDSMNGAFLWDYHPNQVISVNVSGSADTVMSNGDLGKLITFDSSSLSKPAWGAPINTSANVVRTLYQAAWPYPDMATALNIDTEVYLEEIQRIEEYGDIAIYKISTRKGWKNDYSLDVLMFMQWEM